jgi:hypothetical protein
VVVDFLSLLLVIVGDKKVKLDLDLVKQKKFQMQLEKQAQVASKK